jgi:exodeoxyribonuclease VII large subunit
VTGVGHEVDFTIADFVADLRAPTPSGAAELVAPDCSEWTRTVALLARRASRALERVVSQRMDRFVWLERRLAQLHPGVELRQRAQRLDELEQRLARAQHVRLAARSAALGQLSAHLRQHSPALQLSTARGRLELARGAIGAALRAALASRQGRLGELAAGLRQHSPAQQVAAGRARLELTRSGIAASMRRCLMGLNGRLGVAARTLDAVSPLATLQRGYAIVTDAAGTVITEAQRTRVGEIVHARLAHGALVARIERTSASDQPFGSSAAGPVERPHEPDELE